MIIYIDKDVEDQDLDGVDGVSPKAREALKALVEFYAQIQDEDVARYSLMLGHPRNRVVSFRGTNRDIWLFLSALGHRGQCLLADLLEELFQEPCAKVVITTTERKLMADVVCSEDERGASVFTLMSINSLKHRPH